MSIEVIKTENLSKFYGKQASVQSLNMNIKEGDIYGFLGPNGAGKTTTIRMLIGLIKPSEGEIQIFGREFKRNKLSILKNIGSLVESPSYYGQLTGYENLEAIRRITGVNSKRIQEVLEIVRLTEAANKQVKNYSLGMKQRLGIASALLQNPKLLILDEPTNGLDPAGIQEIRELIKLLPQQYGMTVLVSSHLLGEIEQMATKVGIIVQGELIYQDSIQELRRMSAPTLKVGVNNPEEAKNVLIKNGWDSSLKGDYLYVEDTTRDNASSLNYVLVNNGFSVFRLEERKTSLEEIFLNLTSKGESL